MNIYIALHKVRGQPAMDFVEPTEDGGWIVPTSGHACRPLHVWHLHDWDFFHDSGMENYFAEGYLDTLDDWKALGDHYASNDKPAAKGAGSGLRLMDFINIPPPKVNLRRRI